MNGPRYGAFEILTQNRKACKEFGNSHGVSSHFNTAVFDMLRKGAYPIENWKRTDFTDGVRLLPKAQTMSGDYIESWAQWRFLLADANDKFGCEDYVTSIVRQLEREYRDEVF